jgi:tRNA pseudouridine55 synthase
MRIDLENGNVFLVYKPQGWTSFDVVNKMRNALVRFRRRHTEVKPGEKVRVRVGHAGTLDPLAEGLLIVCAGKETRNIDRYMGMVKEYTGTLFLGATTPSHDRETAVDRQYDISHISPEVIKNTAGKFIGEQMQVPPVYSAIKQGGKKAYESARAGEALEMKPRQVQVYEFEITEVRLPEVDFRVVCSKGTYIRSLVYDFGKALGAGAYLTRLCRTRIGTFELAGAMSVEDFVKEVDGQ